MSYPLKFAAILATSDGENEIVAAVAGKSIVVVSYVLHVVHATAAGLATFIAGTANTVYANLPSGTADLSDGAIYCFAGTEKSPAFAVVMSDSLAINCASGVDASGHLAYVLK